MVKPRVLRFTFWERVDLRSTIGICRSPLLPAAGIESGKTGTKGKPEQQKGEWK
jgi:hypothetical protein